MINWRSLGDVPLGIWTRTLYEAGSPLKDVAPQAYAAAQPHTALCLAQLDAESSYWTRFRSNTKDANNPLNLRPENGDGYLRFPDPVAGIQAWRDRITSETYKDGIYARTVTVSDLIHRYAPSSDNNDEAAYVASIMADLLRWGIEPKEEEPVSELVFGRVAYPLVIASHLPADNPMIKTSGAPDIPDAVVWHRMLGTFRGTNQWFLGGNAATCYGIGCASDGVDSAADDGAIFEWIAPGTGWYGESSGPVNSPYGDGLALVQKVGALKVNRVTKAIEVSRNYETPLSEKARISLVNLTAYWADQKRIPWNVFPMVPGELRSFVIWHQEITLGSRKVCPGYVVMNETPALIERVRQVLKAAQTAGVAPKPPVYAASELPDWWAASLIDLHPGDQSEDGVRYRAMRRNFRVKVKTSRRSRPDTTSEQSGPSANPNELLFGERLVEAGGKRFILTNDGHYILESKVSPRVRLTAW